MNNYKNNVDAMFSHALLDSGLTEKTLGLYKDFRKAADEEGAEGLAATVKDEVTDCIRDCIADGMYNGLADIYAALYILNKDINKQYRCARLLDLLAGLCDHVNAFAIISPEDIDKEEEEL